MVKLRRSARTGLRNLTVLAALPLDAHARQADRLATLRYNDSPFAQVPGTHFARLALLGPDEFITVPPATGMRPRPKLLDRVMHGGKPQQPDPPSMAYLLLAVTFDGPRHGPVAAYVEGLRVALGGTADLLWGLCSDYPGRDDPGRFREFLLERSVPSRYSFTASDRQPAVEVVTSALERRRQVIDLVLAAPQLAEAELARRIRQVAWRGTKPANEAKPDPMSMHALLSTPPPEAHQPAEARPALADPVAVPEVLTFFDPVSREDPDLDDVQNLVASGYPRHLDALHVLLRVTDPVAARAWLARIAEVIPTAGWASAQVDRLDRASRRTRDPGPDSGGLSGGPRTAVHVALSHHGLAELGLPEGELAGFSAEFRAGMASREPGLAPERGVDPWQPPFSVDRPVDALLLISALDRDTLESSLDDRPWLRPSGDDGFAIVAQWRAGRLRDDRERPPGSVAKPGFVEHFGYVDGLSQPKVHGVTTGRRVAELPAGEVLLGYEDVDGDVAGAGLPAELARNGSYLVYRKLEQDVPAFREFTHALGAQLHTVPGTDPHELAAAKVMGRWRDGTPTTLSPNQADPRVDPYSFNYQKSDAEGHGCPVGAHIRRVNPRDSGPVIVDTSSAADKATDLEGKLAQRHRMLRRGIPYGPLLPEGEMVDDEERGLLFIALVGDLRRQFEFIQAHWMSDGNAFRLGSDRDPLSGAGEGASKFVAQGRDPVFVRPPRPLVTCRGGEYFFLPGLAALRRIAAL